MLKFNDFLKEAKKCTDEELVGNQHKLDKNKNGKLDADDFKKLRSTKEEKSCKEEKACKEEDEMEGYVSHAQRKAVWASRNEKGVKEETELDEKYDHGPIDREASVKIGHHAAVVSGSGVDSGKHGKIVGQSRNHVGDQWHIKTADGEIVKMYKNRVAKLKEETEYTIEDFSIEELEEFMMSEEFEQLDEISKKVLGSYVKKASSDLASSIHGERDAEENDDEDERKSMAKRAEKRMSGLEKAGKKIAKEEVEQIDEISAKTKLSYIDKASRHAASHVYNAKDKANWASHYTQAGDWESSKKAHDQSAKEFNKANKRLAGVKAAVKSLAKNVKEEAEQIDELSKKTLASYIPKAAQSARFSGMTAMDMQNRSDRARNKGMKDSYHRLSMKYKNKAWDREDNIKKAAQKLAREEVEQIDELSKGTLKSYLDKAGDDAERHRADARYTRNFDKNQSADSERKADNREFGMTAASRKLKMKEETEQMEADYLSPTVAFLDSLGEGKIDDLKDRMRMKQATQSAFDKDYKPAEKQHSNITVHKGTSYGAQDNGDEDEKDEKPEAKEKRGRGRPAGSKSGARV
jgi:hypothetical protein